MAIRTLMPRLTLEATGGATKVVAGLQITGGATEVSAAAWLVWKHRAAFHKRGVMDFEVDDRRPPPKPWFAAAIAVLRDRPDSWHVITLQKGRHVTTFRVAWLDWRAQRSRGKS